jgi:hypothetical protein
MVRGTRWWSGVAHQGAERTESDKMSLAGRSKNESCQVVMAVNNSAEGRIGKSKVEECLGKQGMGEGKNLTADEKGPWNALSPCFWGLASLLIFFGENFGFINVYFLL